MGKDQYVNRVNLFTTELDLHQSREGYRWRGARLGERLGAELIGASLYELEAGQLSFPFHFHHGVEEWLYVVAGQPTLRSPSGERTLNPGELVCFMEGPEGAHALRGPGRVLILSDKQQPSISVYPGSDKLGTRPSDPADRLNFRRDSAIDYWDGE